MSPYSSSHTVVKLRAVKFVPQRIARAENCKRTAARRGCAEVCNRLLIGRSLRKPPARSVSRSHRLWRFAPPEIPRRRGALSRLYVPASAADPGSRPIAPTPAARRRRCGNDRWAQSRRARETRCAARRSDSSPAPSSPASDLGFVHRPLELLAFVSCRLQQVAHAHRLIGFGREKRGAQGDVANIATGNRQAREAAEVERIGR